MSRPIHEIAKDIASHWAKPYFGAERHLRAMHDLEDVKDNYGADSGYTIVLYFLSNAATFRGSDARRIKAELR